MTLEQLKAQREALQPLIDLLALIHDWDPPAAKGRRTFDDREFAESLTRQFQQKGTLSDRQQGALRKVLAKYASQIPDYETRANDLGLQAPTAAPTPTDAVCPECGAPLLQRTNRRKGTTFFGCSAFPKCRFLCNELPPKSAGESDDDAPQA